MIRSWLPDEGRFEGWYVNLVQPRIRTPVGFDSRDDVLDIVASNDLSEWRLKDEDELDFAVEVGMHSPHDAQAIRHSAELAVDDIIHRRWPFHEAAWRELHIHPHLEPAVLPVGWDEA